MKWIRYGTGKLILNRHFNNENTRIRREICSKLTEKTPEQLQWRRSGVLIVNVEHILDLVLVFLIVNFKHVIAGRIYAKLSIFKLKTYPSS